MATGSVLSNASPKPSVTLLDQSLHPKRHVRTVIFEKPTSCFPSLLCSSSAPKFTSGPISISKSKFKILASSPSADPTIEDESPAIEAFSDAPSNKKKLGVVVKLPQKSRLVLKFIWMQKDIGIALNQVILGYGTIPLSPYYFWPRKDAWEELKVLLASKPWISETQKVHLLNQATDIINLWQESGGALS